VRHVHAVFDVLDDGEEDVDVALEKEGAFDVGEVGVLDKVVQLAVVIGENDHRDVEPRIVHPAGKLVGAHVAHLSGADDDVVAAEVLDQFQRLVPGRHARQVGHVVQIEAEKIPQHELVDKSILRQHKRVVQARNQQDLIDPPQHQVLKTARVIVSVDLLHQGSVPTQRSVAPSTTK